MPSNLFFDASLMKESRDKNDFSLLLDCSVILEEIEIITINEQFMSIRALIDEKIILNKLDITFKIDEADKYFVKKINIFGNNITQENVIRNQFEIDEGDPFNEILQKKTINNFITFIPFN